MTLAHLIENDIVRRIDNGPPARYGFKHALLGDAAYESLLRSSRREIHTSIASFIEKGSPDTSPSNRSFWRIIMVWAVIRKPPSTIG